MKRRKRYNAIIPTNQLADATEDTEQLKFWHYAVAVLAGVAAFAKGVLGLWERELTFDKYLYVGDEAAVLGLGFICFGIGYFLVMTSFAVVRWPKHAVWRRFSRILARPKLVLWSGIALFYSSGLFYLRAQLLAGFEIQLLTLGGLLLLALNYVLNSALGRLTNGRATVSIEL
jgi:hypothetical protein